jgi:sec-independent protein translocase protein TatA
MSIGITELLVILAIVVVLFGTKKLRGMGSDLGAAIRSFRSAMRHDSNRDAPADLESDEAPNNAQSR